MNEPIADAVRGILDGHIVLSRQLAHAGHYPAVDVLSSVSRLVGEIVSPEARAAGNEVRKLMATYKEKADLISIGAYQPGSDPRSTRPSRPAARSTASSSQGVTDPPPPKRPTCARAARQLGGAFQAPGSRRRGRRHGARQGGMPLHNAIPPLHIPS